MKKSYVLSQERLRTFLKDFRSNNDLSAEQAAEKLGLKIASYRTMEGLIPKNRAISCLKYLQRIADLRSLSVTDFILLLEPTNNASVMKKKDKRQLYKWETTLLSHFDKLGIPLRNRFIDALNEITPDQLGLYLRCLIKIIHMKPKQIEALVSLINEMA